MKTANSINIAFGTLNWLEMTETMLYFSQREGVRGERGCCASLREGNAFSGSAWSTNLHMQTQKEMRDKKKSCSKLDAGSSLGARACCKMRSLGLPPWGSHFATSTLPLTSTNIQWHVATQPFCILSISISRQLHALSNRPWLKHEKAWQGRTGTLAGNHKRRCCNWKK